MKRFWQVDRPAGDRSPAPPGGERKLPLPVGHLLTPGGGGFLASSISVAGGYRAPLLWAKSKRKKRKAPDPRPGERKKVRRKVAPPLAGPARKARKPRSDWATRLEKGIGDWLGSAGVDTYDRADWARLGILAAAMAVVLLLYSFSAGGYFVVRRSYGELMILYLLVLGLLFSLPAAGKLSRLGMIEVGAFGAYGFWILLSVTWSYVPANSFNEFMRTILYLAGFALFYIYFSRREWLVWLGHLFVVIVFIVALASLWQKIFPNPEPYEFDARLSWPLTYWNSMAVLMVMAFPIGLRAAAQKGAHLIIRCLYGLALLMFLIVLFFTFWLWASTYSLR